jgi:hypothetical protein
MLLAEVRLVGVGPVEDLTFRFAPVDEAPRPLTVIVGGGGVGKTSLLSAIASTRPGQAMPQSRPWSQPRAATLFAAGGAEARPVAPFAVADWMTGDDDPARPHPLRVASPNAVLDEKEDEGMARRREQAVFERRAAEGGFALLAISGARWFSRAPLLLSSPERTLLRHDARAAASFDDATRADLARETKQVLAYAAIAAALGRGPARTRGEGETDEARGASEDDMAVRALDAAVRDALSPLLALVDHAYEGIHPVSLEPTFRVPAGALRSFDELPARVRHLVALAALPVRALAAAYPGCDPRRAQGVVLVDDVDLHQDAAAQRGLAAALRVALPRVQWIVTTSSPAVAAGCAAGEVLALRRMPASPRVELHDGDGAILH